MVRTALGFSACCVVGSILAALVGGAGVAYLRLASLTVQSATTGKVGLLLGGRVLMGLGSVGKYD